MNRDFCVLILSHNRPNDIPTIQTLERHGYTGDWYIVVDHEDDYESYTSVYDDEKIIYFDKDEVVDDVDRADNFDNRNCNVYARNKSFEIAQELGYEYFMMADDDYTGFEYKFDEDFDYGYQQLNDLDKLIEGAIDLLGEADIDVLAFAQNGDFIGGSESQFGSKVQTKRKIMNTFICRSDNPIEFRGTINEDVNAYTRNQQLGDVYLTVNFASVAQEMTQQHEGGLTDIYLDKGTYVKSFYTILFCPSSVGLMMLEDKHKRIHHKVDWRKTVPKMLSEDAKNTQ